MWHLTLYRCLCVYMCYKILCTFFRQQIDKHVLLSQLLDGTRVVTYLFCFHHKLDSQNYIPHQLCIRYDLIEIFSFAV